MATAVSTFNYNADEIEKQQDDERHEVEQARFMDSITKGIRKHRIEGEKKIILLWVLAQHARIKGYETGDSLQWLFDNRALLLQPLEGHLCTKQECEQFRAQPGQPLRDSITGECLIASGDVFICALTGMAHECPATATCRYTTIERNDHRDGFYCPVTLRMKGRKITTVEGYSAEKPISKARFDQQVVDEDNALQDNKCEDSDDDDGDDDDNLMDYEASSDEDVAHDESTPHSDDMVGHETRGFHTDDFVHRLIDQSEKTARKTVESPQKQLPPKRQRVIKVIADMTPGERIGMHLKDLDKKQELARSIVKFVMSFGNQARLYTVKLEELGGKATQRVNSQKRKAKRALTTIECANIFLAFMSSNLPPRPRSIKGVYFGRYTNAIMQAWLAVSQSPYARGVIMPKQKPLKFEKIAFGLLYRIAAGGYKVNCSLPPVVLQHINLATECPDLYSIVCNFQIGVITYDQAVCDAIVDSSQLVELRAYSYTNAQPDARTVNEGFKLLENCYKSIFRELGQECIKRLQKGEDKRLSVQAYIDACISKKVPVTAAVFSASH